MPAPFLSRWRAVLRVSSALPAVVGESRPVTFAGIQTAAENFAASPVASGIAGRIVLLHRPNGSGWLAGFLGLHLAGAVIVPVDADTPAAGVSGIALRLGAAGVLDAAGFAPTGVPGRRKPGAFLGKLSSGSTGAPKVFFFTEKQMIADADAVCDGMGIGPGDLNHAGLPFGHSYALGNLILPLFVRGVPMSLATGHFPGVVADEIAARRATVFPTVPNILNALARSPVAPDKLASLRLVITAGARFAPEDARAFAEKFQKRVHNFYGSSETGGVAYDRTGDDTLTGDAVGTPLPGVKVSRMRTGRLLVSGPAVRTLGNRRRSGPHGAEALADIGRIDAGGRIVLEGRHAALLKIGGRRINPGEIASALRSAPGVIETVVLELPVPGGESRLAAVVVGTTGASALKSFLREKLPAWKIPSRFVTVEKLPVNARGKLDRAALPGLFAGE